jgi:hypothetical protein
MVMPPSPECALYQGIGQTVNPNDRGSIQAVRTARAYWLFRQSRTISFVEAVTNVVVGFLLAVLTQIAVFPVLGLRGSIGDNLLLGAIFTTVSIVRSFTLRRLFEAIRSPSGRRW